MDELPKRSPRAPAIPLKDALERALKIYEKEGRHAVPMDVAAQDIGYKDAQSGAARSVLATLRQFGLIIRPKEGHVSVSRELENYKFAPDEIQKHAAVVQWLKSPAIYSTLLNKFSDRLPSDAALKFEFIQLGFLRAAVDEQVTIFKESVEFSGYYTSQLFEAPAETGLPGAERVDDRPSDTVPRPSGDRLDDIPVESDRILVRLAGGRKAWLELPSPFYEADKKNIKAQIDVILTDDQEETKSDANQNKSPTSA